MGIIPSIEYTKHHWPPSCRVNSLSGYVCFRVRSLSQLRNVAAPVDSHESMLHMPSSWVRLPRHPCSALGLDITSPNMTFPMQAGLPTSKVNGLFHTNGFFIGGGFVLCPVGFSTSRTTICGMVNRSGCRIRGNAR